MFEQIFKNVDVIGILTDSPNPRKYWSVLKTRLKKEDSELTTICSQLKMQSDDGKFYDTDVAASTTEIAKTKDVQGLPENKKAAIEGGTMNESEKKLRKRDQSLSDAFKGGGQIVPPPGIEFDTAGGRQIHDWGTYGKFS